MIINRYDSIVIGAGAAGLMCAALAGARGRKVLLLDHSHKLAEKIRISGGGRCNFTNINTAPECYISNTPKFCISPLSRYTPKHFIELLNKYNITYHEKTLGQLFCDGSSEQIIELLDSLGNDSKVKRCMGVSILCVEKELSGFKVATSIGDFVSESVVIATGGLSIPQIGATGFGYNIARQFGHNIIKTDAALVPLALSPEELQYLSPLSGTSFFSSASINKTNFQENTLITHRGLSGPAILQISSYWSGGVAISLDMLPNMNITEELSANRSSNKLLENFLAQFFSMRLASSLCAMLQINKSISQLSKSDIHKISNFIHNFTIKPTGSLGYKKAEVTKGGVDCKELSSKSMMSNKVEGLFFIGEVVDVTGWLGGYNFQWAWASAFAAAQNI
jgi:predicted Rossmann fold flavoprotein